MDLNTDSEGADLIQRAEHPIIKEQQLRKRGHHFNSFLIKIDLKRDHAQF